MTALWTYLVAKVGKVAAIIIATLAAGALLYAIVTVKGCIDGQHQAAQSGVDQGQHGALQQSAADAVNTQGAVNANTMASEDLTRRNAEEIRNAKGADAAVDPAVRDAGLRALCRRPSAAHDPACRVFQPHTP